MTKRVMNKKIIDKIRTSDYLPLLVEASAVINSTLELNNVLNSCFNISTVLNYCPL